MKEKNNLMPLKLLLSSLLIGLLVMPVNAQRLEDKPMKEVKNVILMITDGTSIPVLSAARWYKKYFEPNAELAVDPYITGTINTFCSNAPIGDSAPTTSCYMTGIPSIAGFVATYPYSDPGNDLFPLDSDRAYRPLMTLLEATKIKHNRKTGLVVTCEFSNATPADCASHSYDRNNREWIVPQMIHNNIDVVIGGGVGLIKPEYKSYLLNNGYSVILNDYIAAKADTSPKTWQLYGHMDVPYDLDRDPEVYPSIAEMTKEAIKRLSSGEGSENGFFLMVEGSKVDWAAHANDPVALITEYIAFDKAVAEAIDFAKKDGNTVVIVTSDHGNSGFSMGERKLKGYAKTPLKTFFEPLSKIKKTSSTIADMLNESPYEKATEILFEYAGITLTEDEIGLLQNCRDYKNSPIPQEKKSSNQIGYGGYEGQLPTLINHFFMNRMPFGFTTNGHTAEEVFLSIYAPNDVPRIIGNNFNYQLHQYMADLLGIGNQLPQMSDYYFAPHDEVFKGYKYDIQESSNGTATLVVFGKNRKSIVINSNESEVVFKKRKRVTDTKRLNTVAVYVDKTGKMYIPTYLREWIE